MAWVSPKVYAILQSSEEGKDILEGIADKTQEEVDKELDAFFGNGGKGFSRSEDYKQAKSTEEEDEISDDDIMAELSDGDYYYGDLSSEKEIVNLMAERLNVSPDRVKKVLKDNDFDFKEYQKYINGDDFEDAKNDDDNKPIDYETVEYPRGTSKEYSMVVNDRYEKALPVLEKLGIKLSDFGGRPSKEGGFEDDSSEIMDKYVFEPFRQKYPNGNNEVWLKEYQPIYDAIEAITDKNYNDWYIKNKK